LSPERLLFYLSGPFSFLQVVDFAKLEMSSLKKYQRYFKLDTVRPNANKEELIRAVTKHFVVEPKLREAQVISQFLFALRRGMQSIRSSDVD
jgi:hypothetical protein